MRYNLSHVPSSGFHPVFSSLGLHILCKPQNQLGDIDVFHVSGIDCSALSSLSRFHGDSVYGNVYSLVLDSDVNASTMSFSTLVNELSSQMAKISAGRRLVTVGESFGAAISASVGVRMGVDSMVLVNPALEDKSELINTELGYREVMSEMDAGTVHRIMRECAWSPAIGHSYLYTLMNLTSGLRDSVGVLKSRLDWTRQGGVVLRELRAYKKRVHPGVDIRFVAGGNDTIVDPREVERLARSLGLKVETEKEEGHLISSTKLRKYF